MKPPDVGVSSRRAFHDQYQPPNFYAERRHLRTKRKGDGEDENAHSAPDWRMRERMKTVSVVLVLCLNIGVDPPDLVKTNPSAKLECWVDPFSLPANKALETIGRNLQTQYEVLQPRARYRLSLDPSVEETKKLCCSLRRNAKEERILFHYNGHGVPKPTPSGELWVFNKNYTQYIPISIYDVQTWLGSPCVYVYDCSNAGDILNAFNRFAAQRDAETAAQNRVAGAKELAEHDKETPIPMEACIQLAACKANQVLPMNPDLPADVFTSCLTTPLEIALRWAVTQNPLLSFISPEMIMKIPGRLNDRRTPLGELNWIFTAITDTIAWTTLPHDLFKRLYRQDLMVAALFRNFLLAERIMRYYMCTPVSSPALPPTHQHPMWQSWDLAADCCVAQLPALLAAEAGGDGPPVEYQNSAFFAEQLTAFDVWLSKSLTAENPPEQLPIVLQVLLSQVHRLRAMMLLSRFLDIGPWAVNLALLVGIFPYVLKLLQSPAPELKPLLIFIWTKILVVDRSCQTDLLKDNGFMYFIKILASPTSLANIPNPSGLRAMSVFILSVFCQNFPIGQQACVKGDLIPALIDHLAEEDPLLRQWSCIGLSKVWENHADGKWVAVERKLHEHLCRMLRDPVPDVRAAALCALRTLIGDLPRTEHVAGLEVHVANAVLSTITDASPLVRRELVCILARFVHEYPENFVTIATDMTEDQVKHPPNEDTLHVPGSVTGVPEKVLTMPLHDAASLAMTQGYIWKGLLTLSVDSALDVAAAAIVVVDFVMAEVVTHLQFHGDGITTSSEHSLSSLKPKLSVAPSFSESDSNDGTVRQQLAISQPTSANTLAEGAERASSNGTTASGLSDKASATKKKQGVMADIDTEVFFEWSCTFFAEPQMQTPSVDDPGSVRFIEREWRRERNCELSAKKLVTPLYLGTETLQEHGRLTFQGALASKIAFHSYENHLATSEGHHEIRIYDAAEQTQLQCFDNGNPAGSRITFLRFINETDLTLVAAGSDDGVIQLYSKHAEQGHIKRISAWRALPELAATPNGPGLVADWHQATGLFMCAGESRVIRIWDANKETCVQIMPTKSLKAVTCVTTDRASGDMVFAGFADGTVQVYDRREPLATSVVRTYKEHKDRILAVRQVGTGVQDAPVVSGSVAGDVRVWDLRASESVRKLDLSPGRPISAFDVHPAAPLFACGNESGIRVADVNGNLLGTTRYSDGFLAQRMGTINCVAFHPLRLALAATSALSPWISLYSLSNDPTSPVPLY
ncbi:hypothetical protein HKX48_008735 [Thoreauomyces humboldtii]|nr:hypothetical protein HKX48_008735 [Thoreauomyces humboldtii]